MNLNSVAQMSALWEMLRPEQGLPPAILMQRIVAAAREHLDADVGFVCEFAHGRKVIRKSDGDVHGVPLEEGATFELQETYCYRVVAGTLPNVLHDARADTRVCDLDITRELDIGTYISVPVKVPGGRTYGTLCCISHEVDPSIQARDVKFMRVLGDLLGAQMGECEDAEVEHRRQVQQLRDLAEDGLRIVFQPIVSLDTGATVGLEALARFDTQPYRTPDKWFADAWRLGIGEEVELIALRAALLQLALIPDGVYLSVNASPATVVSAGLSRLLDGVPPGRIVIEVTEHAVIDEYAPFMDALERCGTRGARIAVDDFGAGYSGLSHALQVCPRVLKLDMQLTRDIHSNAAKQALAVATVGFAAHTAIDVVAEGVETPEEAAMLRQLGVRYGQGYYFGRPAELPF